MKKCVIKLGGSVLVNEDSYRIQASEIMRLSEVVEKVYVVLSAGKGETDRAIEALSNGEELDLLKRALQGEYFFPAYESPSVAALLLQPEIDSAYRMYKHLPFARLLIQDEHFPLVASSSYLSAVVDLESSIARKDYLLGDERVVIIPGFGAINKLGEKVLLGRNASDVVAAMIARISQADKVVFLKDVEGIYLNFGKNSQRLLRQVDYRAALSIDFGKVLDRRVIEVLAGSGIDALVGHYAQLFELAVLDNCGTKICF